MGRSKEEYMEQQDNACEWCDERATTTVKCSICGCDERRCDQCKDE